MLTLSVFLQKIEGPITAAHPLIKSVFMKNITLLNLIATDFSKDFVTEIVTFIKKRITTTVTKKLITDINIKNTQLL